MSRRKIRRKQQQEIAGHRMNILCLQAEKQALQGHFHHADRYIMLARRISMKTQTPIPKRFKRSFCKHCYRFLLPGVTGRVRIQHGKIIMFCTYCKRYHRIPLYPRKTSIGYSRI